MVSSPGGSGSPPNSPTPGGTIMPQGQSTPYRPNWINFLGDTNVPSTGLTPDMLARIDASNGPPPGAMAAPSGLTSGAEIQMRQQLAQQLAATKSQNMRKALAAYQTPERGYNTGRGGGGSGHGAGGGMGGGWGGR